MVKKRVPDIVTYKEVEDWVIVKENATKREKIIARVISWESALAVLRLYKNDILHGTWAYPKKLAGDLGIK